MIYEKRVEKDNTAVETLRGHIFLPDKKAEKVTVYNKEAVCPIVTQTVPSKKIKKRYKLAKKRTRVKSSFLAKFTVVMCCIIFCFFTLDFKVFDKQLSSKAVFYLGKGINKIFYEIKGNAQKATGEENIHKTQYSRFVDKSVQQNQYNINENNPTALQLLSLQQSADEDAQPTNDTSDSQTLSVSGGASNTFSADGVKYYPITTLDLSGDSLFSLSNETDYSPDLNKLFSKTPKSLEDISVSGNEPLVLIVHTHATECYTENKTMYPSNEATRSYDSEKNVIRVGSEIAQTLSDFGINTLHCTVEHDRDSFINAYTNSANSVKEYLREYPSIKFVIDVHRDAIVRDSGESVKTVANIAKQQYAQLMFVVGTGESGYSHPLWQENLSLALKVQDSVSKSYPDIFRSINLRSVPFNQQLSTGYLLLEVGTSANTLDEALISARAFAQGFAKVILS